MVKAIKQRRPRRSHPTESHPVSLLPYWWRRAEAAVARGQARNPSHFVELALVEAEQVGVSIIDAVNDIGVPPPEPKPA